MKINIMREYVRLAANKNYTKTAEELFMTQSVLSRHIASLEEELNVKLIDRDRNGFALTPAGEIVLEEFETILTEYESMLDRLARQEKLERGEIHLGYLYYDAEYYVAKIRDVFRSKYPEISLILHPYQPAQLEEELLAEKIDMAILYGVAKAPVRDIDFFPFLKIPFFLFYHKSHRFATLMDISIADLNGEKLLIPDKPFVINHVREMMDQMLAQFGAVPEEEIPVNNYDEVPWILKESGAVFISPMVKDNVYGDEVKTRHLMPELYQTDVSAVWLKKHRNPAIKYLVSAIRSCYP